MESIVIAAFVAGVLLAPLGILMLALLMARRLPDRRVALLWSALAVVAVLNLMAWMSALAEPHDAAAAFESMVAIVFSAGSLIAVAAAWLGRTGSDGTDLHAPGNG